MKDIPEPSDDTEKESGTVIRLTNRLTGLGKEPKGAHDRVKCEAESPLDMKKGIVTGEAKTTLTDVLEIEESTGVDVKDTSVDETESSDGVVVEPD